MTLSTRTVLSLGLLLAACAGPAAPAPAPLVPAEPPPPPPVPEWRALPPPLTMPAPATPTPVVTERLPGGGQLIMAVDPQWSVTYLTWAVPGGVLYDGPRLGLGALASDALLSTRTEESANALRDQLKDIGGHVRTDSTVADDEVSLWVPSAHTVDAVSALAGLLETTTLGATTLKHALNRRVDAYFELLDRPTGRFRVVVEREIFGPLHPFGRPPLGEPRSLARIRPKDVTARLKRMACATDAVLVVAGSFDPKAVGRAIRRHLPKKRCRGRLRKLPRVDTRPGLRFMARDGVGQVSVRAGLVAKPGASVQDLSLVANVLMGDLDASISRFLRGELGATYASATYVDARPGATVLRFATEVDPAQAGTVAALLRDVVRRLTVHPLEPEELAEASARLARGDARRRFSSPEQAATLLTERAVTGRALVPAAPDLDAEALRARLAKSLDPNRWVILMMGDPDKALPPLKAADVGPILIAR